MMQNKACRRRRLRRLKSDMQELGTNGWLMHVILATQEAEIRRITVQSQPGHTVQETLSRKNPSQKVEWLKVKALSSNPSLQKKSDMKVKGVRKEIPFFLDQWSNREGKRGENSSRWKGAWCTIGVNFHWKGLDPSKRELCCLPPGKDDTAQTLEQEIWKVESRDLVKWEDAREGGDTNDSQHPA
jgi:hypothetical protein